MNTISIVRPTLLLDPVRVRRNIANMIARARSSRVVFRPHFKTHQSHEIGRWFRDAGVDRITVSSLDMAHYFADDGWIDITIAFPLNLCELPALERLATRTRLGVVVDCNEAVEALQQGHATFHVWIKIDVGSGRAGVVWSDTERIASLAQGIRSATHLRFAGILAHSGHTYAARDAATVRALHTESLERLARVRDALGQHGVDAVTVSTGDTPACSVATSFDGVDEIRPGNFVFYDLSQLQIGACSAEDIAVAVACPVVSRYPGRGEVVLYGGAVHFSRDALVDPDNGERHFGVLASATGLAWSGVESRGRLVSVSQEHGILRLHPALLQQVAVGDRLVVMPVHSCLTADLYDAYRSLDGRWISRRRSNDRSAGD